VTRKDFLFLADALKRARPALPWTGLRAHLYEGWEAAVRQIAFDIHEQTEKFDVQMFFKNAGVHMQGLRGEGPMPWCEQCRCYHMNTAPHINTGERR
jgi:hypothetical protein